ncbi:tetratricopeptide repeat protein [Aliifodinibius sp. S!AR15-10]|uniref:tetratricopeptide repeat protein n=1 Tax=Aliifodinibius sp. S!AR15-10 TaxID=2950437 RepID=UPI0028675EBA|nr:tetratricopeptide repeat protein [Aliifodinibius sp. S!AR15-10]MDR8392835.1 tetratricopeptide repeat protein [Aliifodinibius sp. S!AR15-10]
MINDTEFRPVAREAVDSLYNFNPEAADALLEPWKQQYPDHPLWMLFDGIELWWQILADLENTAHDEKFFNLMGRVDYQSGRLLSRDRDHADALIMKAISNGYIARQYANRDQWITSVNQARKAFNAYQYLQEVQPDLPDLKMAEGLKLYYSEYLPDAYPIVKTVSWFLPDGNKQKGLALLADAAESSIFAQAEARYFLANISLLYEEDYQTATENFEQLYQAYPNNSYYARILVRGYFRMQDYDRALRVIDTTLARWRSNNLPFEDVLKEELLTWKGRIYFRRFQYAEAATALEPAFEVGKSLSDPGNRSQHVIAGYYLGRSYLRTGDKEKARKYLEAVTDMDTQDNYRDHAGELLDEHF